jgi:hypothetical protein
MVVVSVESMYGYATKFGISEIKTSPTVHQFYKNLHFPGFMPTTWAKQLQQDMDVRLLELVCLFVVFSIIYFIAEHNAHHRSILGLEHSLHPPVIGVQLEHVFHIFFRT